MTTVSGFCFNGCTSDTMELAHDNPSLSDAAEMLAMRIGKQGDLQYDDQPGVGTVFHEDWYSVPLSITDLEKLTGRTRPTVIKALRSRGPSGWCRVSSRQRSGCTAVPPLWLTQDLKSLRMARLWLTQAEVADQGFTFSVKKPEQAPTTDLNIDADRYESNLDWTSDPGGR